MKNKLKTITGFAEVFTYFCDRCFLLFESQNPPAKTLCPNCINRIPYQPKKDYTKIVKIIQREIEHHHSQVKRLQLLIEEVSEKYTENDEAKRITLYE